MKVKKVINKLNEYTDSQLVYVVKDFNPGHWLNEVNGEWIKTRIYVKVSSNGDLSNNLLSKIVKRINKKSLTSNIEIIIK